MFALRDLQQFVVLAEELSFRRAAEKLHIAQPTLTQTLQRLERAVGTRLVDRGSGPTSLTEAGGVLLDRARLLLRDADDLAAETRSVGRGVRRRLRVGAVNPAMRSLMPAVLRSVHAEFPDVRLSLEPLSSFALVRGLEEGRLDLAVVRTERVPASCEGTVLMHDPMIAVLPSDHPLASRRRVRLRELDGETFVMAPRSRNPTFHDELISLYRQRGCLPSEVIESHGLHSQLALVGAGLGVAVQSVLYLDPARDDLAFVPVHEQLRIPLQLLARSDGPAAVTASFERAAVERARFLAGAPPKVHREADDSAT